MPAYSVAVEDTKCLIPNDRGWRSDRVTILYF